MKISNKNQRNLLSTRCPPKPCHLQSFAEKTVLLTMYNCPAPFTSSHKCFLRVVQDHPHAHGGFQHRNPLSHGDLAASIEPCLKQSGRLLKDQSLLKCQPASEHQPAWKHSVLLISYGYGSGLDNSVLNFIESLPRMVAPFAPPKCKSRFMNA